MTAQTICNAPLRPVPAAEASGQGGRWGSGRKSALGAAQLALDAPADLLAWVAVTPTRKAALALCVDDGRIRQLRRGDCLRISSALLARWQAHKAELPATPWQLRRVGRGGMVVLAGQRWQLPDALVPQREQVLVALTARGALLVRLADGPAMLTIERVPS